MCGIAGVASLDGHPVGRTATERMVEALSHRGPDGRGTFVEDRIALGHVRLSILDPTPAGAQPMARGPLVLAYNGEVYNYLELADELRARGEAFASGSDTEVILAAFRAWGLEAIPRFNGMFAFALWDGDRSRLVLARDRMGVKPLYYRVSARSVAFASEPQALVAAGPLDDGDGWSPEPNPRAIRNFLVRGALDNTVETFFGGILALAPGHLAVVQRGSMTQTRYWGPPPLSDDARPVAVGSDGMRDRELVEEFRALFLSSCRLRLRSDVAIGTCLSGGLDSSAIVATVAQLRAAAAGPHEQMPRLAFHARFPSHNIDESGYAAEVADQNGVHLVYSTPRGTPLLEAIAPVLRAQGEPYGGASIIAEFAVMSAAREEGLKVMLDGQGADELLGGYHQALGIRTAGLLRAGRVGGALHELRGQVSQGTLSPSAALVWGARELIGPTAVRRFREFAAGGGAIRLGSPLAELDDVDVYADPPGTLLAQRLWRVTFSGSLPSLLRYEDRNSMAHGVEARVPFLDYRLVEFAALLPDRLRVNRGVTKVALRRAMSGLIPDRIRDRRDKLGFVAPQRAWLDDGQREVEDMLTGGQLVRRGWIQGLDLERAIDAGSRGRRASEDVWRLLIVELWLRMHWPADDPDPHGAWAAALVHDAGPAELAAR